MPGFTSFLLSQGRFSAAVQEPTPPHSDESETEASKKCRLHQERRRARQLSRIYGTVMTRKDIEHTLGMLKQLKSDIAAQIESFHDMGVASEKKRKEAISEFYTRGQLILGDGVKVIGQFEDAQGAVQIVSEGFMELSRAMVGCEQANGKVDVMDVEGIVTIYQRQIDKPLSDVIKEVGKTLGRKEGWSDPK
ncbi:uncharacterized protein ALTATR162_LOCUS7115 [Alternaria atra]|uniref:Uncharacterized protein n=1 Tax=Alternaria atra TaxID=119953 RepID=A0A8J2I3U7_9PLEO|nr:uncharacterized protein ALTATR162_LOCUS7115 [Alternaria atra]CAG5170008.1 unnamed protein product [Alternaria atra]